MSTTAAPLFTLPSAEPVTRPRRPLPAREPRGARISRLAHGRVTLDELVSGAWAAVAAGAPAACPVCDATLRRVTGDEASGECVRCGAELA